MENEIGDTLRSYGSSFDDLVKSVANSMNALGYPSKHASANYSATPDEAIVLRGLINGLGMLCLVIDSELAELLPTGEGGSPADVETLAVASEAGRLISLLREAQRTRVLTGRAAFELDGDIDELADQFRRLNDFAGLVEAARSIVEGARPFVDGLPGAIKDSLTKMEDILLTHD
ncbi:hypothetical protein [Paractinoplanes durhamensis]|uniref:Uncharacterized protein n=1 Tax=Paractinoplanes durhamensis TaxID=113563 RepID=A0ABQ3Z4D3_9ACTN|nr:hypothetical protein [Actinoplanes durhamensis]GIE04685.1 hypothetical protein Adu01nite_60350 [Actinoplanes durhamensis]